MFDWDDARVFLAAARSTSMAAAAARLGIDAATAGRRVGRLEAALKATLFVRSRSGLQLTSAGVAFFESAQAAESAMAQAGRVGKASDRIAGTVRLSVSEGFGSQVLAPALPEFMKRRPGLRIEMTANPGFLSASRREVDMAITLSPSDAARVVVEPLTTYQLALYASSEYLARNLEPKTVEDLGSADLVGYIDDQIYAPELRYLDEIQPGLKPRIASSSIQAQRAVIAAGGGIGVLPAFLAQGLTLVLPETVIERRFWLSTHREVYETARLRAVEGWVRALAETNRSRLRPF